MEKESKTERQSMNKQYIALTPAELYALEKRARRERAEAQAELLNAAGRWLKRTFAAIAFRPYAKQVRHA